MTPPLGHAFRPLGVNPVTGLLSQMPEILLTPKVNALIFGMLTRLPSAKASPVLRAPKTST